ncbi:MAG: hypothetical protein LN408_04660 [Candidatus Thermoplasmatota archaeon]|nr:hypothetical protein [Candidatus Thermoplasmatota archaeon]
MNKNRKLNKLLITGIIIFTLIFSYTTTGINNVKEESYIDKLNIIKSSSDGLPYEGYLRIYVVEPESRWDNFDGEPYHYGFLGFAFNDTLSIDYQETYSNNIIWNGNQEGYSDIEEDNIMVIAAIFNPEISKAYARPPTSGKFETHFTDAVAGVKPGESKSNIVYENYTHSVLVEEGTATWCPYCPAMANALNNIYITEDYPFYFVALIDDKSPDAAYRVRNDLHIDGFPSAFFDGGDNVVVGGVDNENLYKNLISRTGEREVHELDFTISLDWIGNGELEIDVSITNNEEFFNSPPEEPTITGPISGEFGEEYIYEITAIDPDDNDIYYYIDWGNGTIETKGPYDSEKTVKVKHTWIERGKYTIKVRSRDTYDEQSDWVSLEVSMPNKHLLSYMSNYFNNYPNLLKLISKYLGD